MNSLGRLWRSSSLQERIYVATVLLLLVAHAVDLLTTELGFRLLPNAYEANPIAAELFAHFGLAGAIWLKLIVVLASLCCAESLRRRRGLSLSIGVLGLSVLVAMVAAVHNVYGVYS